MSTSRSTRSRCLARCRSGTRPEIVARALRQRDGRRRQLVARHRPHGAPHPSRESGSGRRPRRGRRGRRMPRPMRMPRPTPARTPKPTRGLTRVRTRKPTRGRDAEADAGTDAQADADAGPDTGTDAGADADAGVEDAGADADADAGRREALNQQCRRRLAEIPAGAFGSFESLDLQPDRGPWSCRWAVRPGPSRRLRLSRRPSRGRCASMVATSSRDDDQTTSDVMSRVVPSPRTPSAENCTFAPTSTVPGFGVTTMAFSATAPPPGRARAHARPSRSPDPSRRCPLRPLGLHSRRPCHRPKRCCRSKTSTSRAP